MEKNWATLKKGDILYLLVPIVNENGEIIYEYQESYVINIKVNEDDIGKTVSIRFKYTDGNKKRRRIEFLIYNWKINEPCIICEKHASFINNKNWYGCLIMCHSNPEQLNEVYHFLIEYKSKEIQMLIDSQKKLLRKLKINQNKNIV